MYERDNCATTATLGFDVALPINDDPERLFRIGTYDSLRAARLTAGDYTDGIVIDRRSPKV